MKKFLILLSSLLILGTAPSFAEVGTPIGGPLSVASVSASLNADHSISDVTVAWVPCSVDIDLSTCSGGSALTGYSVIAYKSSDSATPISSCTVASNVSTCVINGLAFATSYKFKVIAVNAIGTSTPVYSSSYTTNSQDQTVSITGKPVGAYFYGDSDVTLSASATSGLPTSWLIPTPTPTVCSIDSGGTVHALASGSCVVKATQSGTGSSYAPASAYETITVGLNLQATINPATNIQGTSATLNATIPFPGAAIAPTFCISTANSTASCTAPAGVTIGTSTPASVTLGSSTAVSAPAAQLTNGVTYYYWVQLSSGGSDTKTVTSSFTTITGPTIAYTGKTTGIIGDAFTGTLAASGGSGSYITWDASSLATGLTFTPGLTAATISGTASEAGSFNTLFSLTDSNGLSTSINVLFRITATEPTGGSGGSSGGSEGSSSGSGGSATVASEFSISIEEPTNIQSSSATLNGLAQWAGVDADVSFCISLVESSESCVLPAGINISNAEPSLITGKTGSLFRAIATGLKAQSNYYVWAIGKVNGQVYTTKIRKMHTPDGPTVTPKGAITYPVKNRIALVFVATGGSGGYKNWKVTGLAGNINYSAVGDKLTLTGFSNNAAVLFIEVSVTDSSGASTSYSTLLTFTDGKTPQIFSPTGAISQLMTNHSIMVRWNSVAQATKYEVAVSGQVVCTTTKISCEIQQLLGPKAKIGIFAVSASNLKSLPAIPTYKAPVTPIQIVLVNFDVNSSSPSLKDKKSVATFAKLIEAQGFTTLFVQGHTDSTGSTKINTPLSNARAKKVFEYLQGILKGTPISAALKGAAASLPVASNATIEGRAANRRTIISIA
jgi:outer membrane protein OmpA-like peptidoglycan-associated protein